MARFRMLSTASTAVSQFMEHHHAKSRPRVQFEQRRLLSALLEICADTPINRITTTQLLSITDALKHVPGSQLNTHRVLKTFFNWCVRRELIPASPMANFVLPTKIPQRDRVLSDPELAAVLRAAIKIAHTPYGMVLIILIHTGMRKTEAANLNWNHITRETITIPKEITKNNTELVLPNTINGFLALIPKTSDKLFPHIQDWARAKNQFDELCAVDEWVVHDLRRTLSTKMAEWELAPPDVVEAILNHKTGSRSAIQRVYDRHQRLPQMRRALGAYADKLQALMKAH
jgi:integrase